MYNVVVTISGRAAKAPEADYYDAVYQRRPDYADAWRTSVYLPVWKHLVTVLLASGRRRILELGCGPGQLAAMLHHEIEGLMYRGIDFSPVALDMAQAANPALSFELADVRDPKTLDGDYDIVIATELLEHLDDDVGLLRSIPRDVFVIFSVPNFDCDAHVRYFQKAVQIEARYGELFSGLDLRWIRLKKKKPSAIWVGAGTRH